MKKPQTAAKAPWDAKSEAAALAHIDQLTDADRLGGYMANARRLNAPRVWEAAFRRRAALLAVGEPGSAEHDFWTAIHALEGALSDERGRATRLTRARQKITKLGMARTIGELGDDPTAAAGFELLIERKMGAMTPEAIVIRHADQFDAEVVGAARARLSAAGVDPAAMS